MDSERHKLFLKLLMEHQAKIYSYILSLVSNYTDADDILQNTSEILWRRFDQFQPGTNFLSWSLKCAYLETLNFRKKQARARHLIFDNETLEQMVPVLNDGFKTIDHRHEILERCLGKVGESGQKIIKMRYNMDLRPKEIAKRLGYPVPRLYKVISKLHSTLLSCIERTLRVEGLE